MGLFDFFGDVAEGVGDLFGDLGSTLTNNFGEVFEWLSGKKKQQFQEWAQKKTWQREDNAVQRRVADLKRAGLSPTLAAGSAAQTSAPISKYSGDEATKIINAAMMRLAAHKQQAEIARTKAETNTNRLQQIAIDKSIQQANIQIKRSSLEYQNAVENAKYENNANVRHGDQLPDWYKSIKIGEGVLRNTGFSSTNVLRNEQKRKEEIERQKKKQERENVYEEKSKDYWMLPEEFGGYQ